MSKNLIDKDVFSEFRESMGADFASELVTTFLADAPNMLADLRQAAEARDAEGFRRAAHSIKSNAQIFGASALAGQAREMEMSGLTDDPPVAALEVIYHETAAALKGHLDD